MKIEKNISLLGYNTFRVDIKTKYFVEIDSVDTLKNVCVTDQFKNYRHFILGGGSNVLLLHDFDGITLKNMILGKEILREDDDFVYVKVGGGENWHKFVQWTIDNSYLGVENLVYIPGSVGASPVQNIGAYGVEVKDVISEVYGVSFSGEIKKKILTMEDCVFTYRSSIFKKTLKNNFFVTHVVFRLKKWKQGILGQFNLTYGGIRKKMEELGYEEKDLTLKNITDMITAIRISKLPDHEQIGTAGSFFKNPIISQERYVKLKEEFPNLLGFEVPDNCIKLSAGQLLQVCGWKGKQKGKVGTYHNHALILVNHSGGTGQEIADFASTLQQCVWDTYGVNLEPEVNYIQ